jgi:hypothetical protein
VLLEHTDSVKPSNLGRAIEIRGTEMDREDCSPVREVLRRDAALEFVDGVLPVVGDDGEVVDAMRKRTADSEV